MARKKNQQKKNKPIENKIIKSSNNKKIKVKRFILYLSILFGILGAFSILKFIYDGIDFKNKTNLCFYLIEEGKLKEAFNIFDRLYSKDHLDGRVRSILVSLINKIKNDIKENENNTNREKYSDNCYILESIYKKESNYPEIAYLLAKAYFLGNRYFETVDTIKTIPIKEYNLYNDLDFVLGVSLSSCNRKAESIGLLNKAFDRLNVIKDCRAWPAKSWATIYEYNNRSISEYEGEVRNICNEIDRNIGMDLFKEEKIDFVLEFGPDAVPIAKKITFIESTYQLEIRNAAFLLLSDLAARIERDLRANKTDSENAIRKIFYLIKKALSYRKGPGGYLNGRTFCNCLLVIGNTLKNYPYFSKTDSFTYPIEEINPLLKEVEKYNRSFSENEDYLGPAEIAMIIRALNNDKSEIVEIKNGCFSVRFDEDIPDIRKYRRIEVFTSFSKDKPVEIIDINDKDYYVFSRTYEIETGLFAEGPPFFILTRYFKDGKPCCCSNVIPIFILPDKLKSPPIVIGK